MMDVVGIYRGRSYVARLTGEGIWIVTAGGPADAVRREIERRFQALPKPASAPGNVQRRDTRWIGSYHRRLAAERGTSV